jgi:peptidyl-Lys metalloendopeptidase
MARGLLLLIGLSLVACLQVQLAGDAEALTVSLSNPSSEPVVFLVYDTPFDTHNDVFHADIFDIQTSNGVRPTYSGIVIKRRPVITDFLTIRPGQAISTKLNLHKGYNFPEAGEYTVTLFTEMGFYQGELGESVEEAVKFLAGFTLVSDPITVKVAAASAPLVFQAFNISTVGNPNPASNCSPTQASQINTSGKNAVLASHDGYTYLNGRSCSSSLSYYIEWFGACDTTRYNTVTNNMKNIHQGLSSSYPVDCAGSQCTSNTYAYVFPADSTHRVYVCAVFWRVSSNNCVMDSQPGTLVHEMGHFNNVAALQDVTYGITNCKNLAKNNPASAIRNADNYCFYTDSCPR